jgi:hypothetical protein
MMTPESMFISTFAAGMIAGIIVSQLMGRLAMIGLKNLKVNPYEHPKE